MKWQIRVRNKRHEPKETEVSPLMKHIHFPFDLELYEDEQFQKYLPQIKEGTHGYDLGLEILETIGWTPEDSLH